MKRFFKYSLLAISLMSILVTGIAIFFILFLDLNIFKPLIGQAIKKEMQRELAFEGDISFATFPIIRINLRHFSLSEYRTSKKFITADSIQLTLPLDRLFNNQLTLHTISIEGLNITLTRFPDGRTNIDSFLAADGKKMEFLLGQARINNSRFVLHDAMNKNHITLSDLTLESGKLTNNSFSNLELKSKGTIKNLLNRAIYDFAFKLDVPNVNFNQDHISGNNIRLISRASYFQHKIFTELTFTNLVKSAHFLSSEDMIMKILAKKDTQIIKARLNSPLNGEMDSQKLHFPELRAGISVSANHLSTQPIRGNLLGNISMSNLIEQVDANLVGNVESSSIQAKFVIDGFDKPAVNFDVTIDSLNTDQLQFDNGQSKLNNLVNNKSPNNKEIDLSLWPELDVNGSIYIGTALIADTALSGVTFKIQSGEKK